VTRSVRPAAVVLATLVLAMLGVVGAGSAVYAAEDPTISVPSGSATAEVGNIIAVTIRAGDLVDLYAYTLEFTFDPSLIEFVNAVDPPTLEGFGEASVLPDARSVRYLHTALGSSPTASGSAVLVTMRFRMLAAGSTTIEFASAEFVDSTGDTTTRNGVGAYAISVVPEAATGGGLTAAAPDAAGDTPTADGPPHGEATEANGLAGTGASPLAGLSVGVACLLTGAVLVLARSRRRTRKRKV
jgi:hypothetical protein